MIPLSYNVRSLLVRKTTSIATALGIGLVVFVLASAFMVGAGRKDNAIVLRKGSDTEMASSLEVSTLGMIGAAPGVKRGTGGTAVMSGEVVIVIAQDKLGTDGQVSNVLVRGVPPTALDV